MRDAEVDVVEDLQDGDGHWEVLETIAWLPVAWRYRRGSEAQGRQRGI